MLPLGDVGLGNSPYMSSSAFAGNPLLIDLADLQRQGWLDGAALVPSPDLSEQAVNFAAMKAFRMRALALAAGWPTLPVPCRKPWLARAVRCAGYCRVFRPSCRRCRRRAWWGSFVRPGATLCACA